MASVEPWRRAQKKSVRADISTGILTWRKLNRTCRLWPLSRSQLAVSTRLSLRP
jgi:hypothetical protein